MLRDEPVVKNFRLTSIEGLCVAVVVRLFELV